MSKWDGWKRVLVSPPRIYINWAVDRVVVLDLQGKEKQKPTKGDEEGAQMDDFETEGSPVRLLSRPETWRGMSGMALRLGMYENLGLDGKEERHDIPFYQG